MRSIAFHLVAVVLASILIFTDFVKADPAKPDIPKSIAELLTWMPADTQTLIVDQDPKPKEVVKLLDGAAPDSKTAWASFAVIPISELAGGPVIRFLAQQKVKVIVEGSRHFRAPKGLGMMPNEGCHFYLLEGEDQQSADKFMGELSKKATKSEQIENEPVLIFTEKALEDTWTFCVCHPKQNLWLLATSPEYLRQVLQRMQKPEAKRALPDDLPEWKQLDTHKSFRAMRHFDRNDAKDDPSSPIGGNKAANLISDEQAIGLAFSFDPDKEAVPVVRYITDNAASADLLKHALANDSSSPIDDVLYKDGVVLIKISAKKLQANREGGVQFICFVTLAMLGHGVYI